MVIDHLSFFSELSMFTKYRLRLISTVCIFSSQEKSYGPGSFPIWHVQIPQFVNFCFLSLRAAHSVQGLLARALCVQPAQDVGPWEKLPPVCFVVNGSKAHSED